MSVVVLPSVRLALPADASAIAELIRGVAERTFLREFTPSGRLRFLSDHAPEVMMARLQSPEFRYDLVEANGMPAGVVGMRRQSHLFSLYVAADWQRQGLGRLLWDHSRAHALDRGMKGEFTVNSSMNAVPVYERLGFVREGSVVDHLGVQYVPMRFSDTSAQVLR